MRTDTIIHTVSADRFTPCGLAKKLNAIALLESASFRSGRQRYSILMIEEALRVQQTESGVTLKIDGNNSGFPHQHKDLLDVLIYFSNQHNGATASFPIPFGGIGYLSFEFAAWCDSIQFSTKGDPLNMPLGLFLLGHIYIVFDHYTDELNIVGINYHEHAIDLTQAVDAVLQKIKDLDFNYLMPNTTSYAVAWPERDTSDEYCAMVTHIKREIVKGNLLQAVPSRRVSVKTALPPFEAYSRLRRINPSPYLFYIDFGNMQLFGSSPEMHVRINEKRVTIRPIAGTIRRGKTETEDRALQTQLLADPKERAEHLMLVDLARNDLGRVCRAGTITVVEDAQVERFARVMHIVSEVTGDVLDEYNAADVIRATFPAGTVSGAPKIQALKTIDALEQMPRRFYAGLVGYMQSAYNFDSCITIRSALKQGEHLHLQAGGGVVFDSQPQREYQETVEKLQALVEAIQTGARA